MRQRTVKIKFGLRLVALAIITVALSGCSTYYQSYYPDSGVYYGDSPAYSQRGVYSRGAYGYQAVNPAVYPYWSLDYFYFSQYYHPYSVYVGYNEPLYYPYPGWVFGDYRAVHPRGYASFAFGFGYPWHGYGYRYPAYSYGFFSGYSPYYYNGYHRSGRHGRHKIRHIDQRIAALQHEGSYASRRELLGRDRIAGDAGSGLYDSRGSNRSASRSRADILRQRNASTTRSSPRQAVAPDRRVDRLRAPDVRSERRPDRRVLNRDRIRRDGDRSAYQGHRGAPIESIRNREILDSRSSRSRDALDRDGSRRGQSGASRNIRRAPATGWNRSDFQSRQQSGRISRGADKAPRGNLLNRSPRSFGAMQQRPDRRAAPTPSRPPREISRPEASNHPSPSSRSRQSMMRQDTSGRRSNNRGPRSSGGNGRDARVHNRRGKRR